MLTLLLTQSGMGFGTGLDMGICQKLLTVTIVALNSSP